MGCAFLKNSILVNRRETLRPCRFVSPINTRTSGHSKKSRAASEGRIRFYPGSVDATHVPRELKGLRTMFTSFHHFLPDAGRAILQDAVDAGEGIGIFEIPRRAPCGNRRYVRLCADAVCLHALDSSVSLVAIALDLFASDHSVCAAVRWSRVLPADLSATGNAGDCRSA